MKYIFLFIALIISSTNYASTYYVSTSGSDNNNGSSGSPFKTISKAAGVVNAGDIVLISGGTYVEKSITPKSSGTEGNYIVFKPNAGTGNVIVKHPATAQGDKTPVFQLSNRSYIWIEGLQFKDFSYGLACIYISNGTGNVVTNNRFENLGNREVGEWNGNQLVGIYNSVRNVVTNNYFDNIYGDGVNVNSQKSEYNLVCHNTFKNFKGKLRSWGGSNTFSRAVDMQDMANGNNVTAFNYAEDVVHHVWLDRDGSNNVILRNYGNGGSGNVFNESRCRSNVIQENIAVGMKAGYMTSYYTSTNWTLYPRWINNVAYNNTDGFVIHKSVGDEFRNNISYNNSDYNLEFSKAAREQGPNFFSNNLWYSASKTNSILLNHIPQSTTAVDIIDQNGKTKSLPAYSTTSGSAVSVPNFRTAVSESNGLSTDPKFVSGTDLRLQSSSPAKGAGDNGLDLGAFAYYQNSNFGWNASLGTQDVSVYFTNTISSVNRGTETTFTLRLSKASSKIVTVYIVPVAGDAVEDLDVQLSSTTITFQAGETSKTVTVKTGNSAQHDELVAYRLENATNAVVNGRIVRVLRVKAGTATPLSGTGGDEPEMHFYLCFGQSNMSGQGEITEADKTVSDRFKVLRAANHSGQTVGEIYPALAPLAHSGSKMSLTDFFGRKMVELTPDNVTIVVASIAIGSQPIDAFHPDMAQAHYQNAVNNNEWYKGTMDQYGGNLYNRIIEMGQIAKQKGVIKGILFHQGENDSHQSYWGQRVKETYESILADLDLQQSEVPFLVGELGHTDNGGSLGSRNAGIANAVAQITNAHLIPSSGCELLPEASYTLHFTRAGYKVLGERYADKMFSLLNTSSSIQAPYNGIRHQIPGVIQFEHFDEGGNGIAYSDDSPGSETGNTFRSDEDVDIEECTDTDGGYNIGWATAGEWLEYSVDITAAGTYDIEIRVACNGDGRTINVQIGDVVINDIAMPNTGGWQTWETVVVNDVQLTAGEQIMRVTLGDVSYVNLNFIEVKGLITSSATSIEDKLEIHPNPTNDRVHLSKNSDWRLINSNGVEIATGVDDSQIDLSEFPQGIYMLFINNSVHKIIKQ